MSATALTVMVLLYGLQKYTNESLNDPTNPFTTVCFKRMVNGRKIIDRYIRRTFPCDSLARCQLACSIEREFICEGFNFRFGSGPDLGSSCQLTAMPGMNLDLTLDFTSDTDYDFYTRDRNAPAACGFLSYQTWSPAPAYVPLPPSPTPTPAYYPPPDDAWLRPSPVPPTSIPIPEDHSVTLQPPPPRIDLNDIYLNKWNSHGYECFVRARTGFRLHRQVVVMTLNAPTLYDCEFICANERKFLCNILSYRYSSTPSVDNCMLGEKTIKQLEFYNDLVPDRDHDMYIRNPFSRAGCQPIKTFDNDCFERIRSGIRIDQSLVHFSVNTDTLFECELICLHIRHFTCRAFSFRYGGSNNVIGDYNCLLSDYPIPEMDPRRHFIEDNTCELYHRGSYGHGCEVDRWPLVSTPLSPSSGDSPNYTPVSINRNDWNSPTPSSTPYNPSSTPYYPIGNPPTVVTVTSKPYPYNPCGEGGTFCTSPAIPYDYNDLFPPSSTPSPGDVNKRPSYGPTRPPVAQPSYGDGDRPSSYGPARPPTAQPSYGDANRPPSYGPTRPPLAQPSYPTRPPKFRPTRPYYPASDTPIIISHHNGNAGGSGYGPIGGYPPNKLDKLCYITYGAPARLKAAAIAKTIVVVNEQECKTECSRARDTTKFRCATISYWSGHCELSDIEMRDLQHDLDFVSHDTYWLFSWDFTNPKCSRQATIPTATGGVWGSYTVSGRPCKWGTQCSLWKEAGIWTCPVEHGDWDYCCRPDHRCGYSEGYSYPWCYVGIKSKEQWRPCNERYYPYGGDGKKGPVHWPISYIHRQGPPNNNGSLRFEHQPSIVDEFLNSLQFDKENYNKARSASYTKNNSSIIEFQVVDVTDNIANTTEYPISRIERNVSSISNHISTNVT